MTTQAYEIELVTASSQHDFHESLLATITGLPKHEIFERLPEHLQVANSWRGHSFVEVARLLGYNCNRRFIEFDAKTPWPCILRCQVPTIKNGWWALAYANGKVYSVYEWPHVQWFDDFMRYNPELKITSMLQIWMGESQFIIQ